MPRTTRASPPKASSKCKSTRMRSMRKRMRSMRGPRVELTHTLAAMTRHWTLLRLFTADMCLHMLLLCVCVCLCASDSLCSLSASTARTRTHRPIVYLDSPLVGLSSLSTTIMTQPQFGSYCMCSHCGKHRAKGLQQTLTRCQRYQSEFCMADPA